MYRGTQMPSSSASGQGTSGNHVGYVPSMTVPDDQIFGAFINQGTMMSSNNQNYEPQGYSNTQAMQQYTQDMMSAFTQNQPQPQLHNSMNTSADLDIFQSPVSMNTTATSRTAPTQRQPTVEILSTTAIPTSSSKQARLAELQARQKADAERFMQAQREEQARVLEELEEEEQLVQALDFTSSPAKKKSPKKTPSARKSQTIRTRASRDFMATLTIEERRERRIEQRKLIAKARAERTQCDICLEWFTLPGSVRTHKKRMHTKEEDKKLVNPHKLMTHMRRYMCVVCGWSTHTKPPFIAHQQKLHHCNVPTTDEELARLYIPPPPLYACPQPDCDMKAATENGIKVHLRKRHGIVLRLDASAMDLVPTHDTPTQFEECPRCYDKLKDMVDLRAHCLEMHNGRYLCKECDWRGMFADEYNEHLLLNHDNRGAVDVPIPNKVVVHKNQSSGSRFCEGCNVPIAGDFKDYLEHYITVHKTLYVCEFYRDCMFITNTHTHLWTHVQYDHGVTNDATLMPPSAAAPIVDGAVHECNLCMQKFDTMPELLHHTRHAHTHTKQCKVAGCVFKSNHRGRFAHHLRVVHGINDYDEKMKCGYKDCEHFADSSRTLRVHRFRVHGVGKLMRYDSQLIPTTNNMPYKCSVCPNFAVKLFGPYVAHMKRMHDVTITAEARVVPKSVPRTRAPRVRPSRVGKSPKTKSIKRTHRKKESFSSAPSDVEDDTEDFGQFLELPSTSQRPKRARKSTAVVEDPKLTKEAQRLRRKYVEHATSSDEDTDYGDVGDIIVRVPSIRAMTKMEPPTKKTVAPVEKTTTPMDLPRFSMAEKSMMLPQPVYTCYHGQCDYSAVDLFLLEDHIHRTHYTTVVATSAPKVKTKVAKQPTVVDERWVPVTVYGHYSQSVMLVDSQTESVSQKRKAESSERVSKEKKRTVTQLGNGQASSSKTMENSTAEVKMEAIEDIE